MVTNFKQVSETFVATVREHKFSVTAATTKRLGSPGPCPSTPPWLTELVSNGAELDLNEVIVHAGRHFANSLVPNAIPGNSSRYKKAGELAGMILSMAHPRISSAKRLWLGRQSDPDIQRLCSELLGEGAGIALLHHAGAVDLRTVQKQSSTFDYFGRAPGGGAQIDLEFKGTVDNATIQNHRRSFRNKLENSHRLGPPQKRGFDQAVGVIFCGWTHGTGCKRGADFEVMDPGESRGPQPEQAVRELLRYYATRYGEIAGMIEAGIRLFELANRQDLFESTSDLKSQLGRGDGYRLFNRSSLNIESETYGATYWGAFWEPDMVPYSSVSIGGRSSRQYRYAYVGIDRRIIKKIYDRDFTNLLEYRSRVGSFTFNDKEGTDGIGLLLSDGTIILWSSSLPPMDLRVESA